MYTIAKASRVVDVVLRSPESYRAGAAHFSALGAVGKAVYFVVSTVAGGVLVTTGSVTGLGLGLDLPTLSLTLGLGGSFFWRSCITTIVVFLSSTRDGAKSLDDTRGDLYLTALVAPLVPTPLVVLVLVVVSKN